MSINDLHVSEERLGHVSEERPKQICIKYERRRIVRYRNWY